MVVAEAQRVFYYLWNFQEISRDAVNVRLRNKSAIYEDIPVTQQK